MENPIDAETAKEQLYKMVRPEIRELAIRMELKFLLHEPERGDPFKPTTFDFLLMRFEEEWEELITAFGQGTLLDADIIDGKTPEEVWREVADNCNLLCMMGVHYERQYKEHYKKVRYDGLG